MPQICTLSVIYGRTFESLFGALIDDARTALQSRILSLPMDTRVFAGTRNRAHSIERLARRLAEEQASHGSA